jgi:LacI family transcriptional regulator
LPSVQRSHAAFSEYAASDKTIETMAVDSDFTLRGGYAACPKLLTRFSPTAIVAMNDITAVGALHYATIRGVRVPGDLSVIGFDDIPSAEFSQPSLTTVGIPRDMIGVLAFRALREMLDTESHEGEEYRVTPKLVVRESTGAARTGAQ